MEREIVLLGAARTPIGRFMGALSSVPAPTLGAIAIREALSRAQVGDALPDEVLMGGVIQAGQGQAPAGIAGRAARHGGRDGCQQGVRLGAQDGDDGGTGDPRRRRKLDRGRGHGKHVARPLPLASGP